MLLVTIAVVATKYAATCRLLLVVLIVEERTSSITCAVGGTKEASRLRLLAKASKTRSTGLILISPERWSECVGCGLLLLGAAKRIAVLVGAKETAARRSCVIIVVRGPKTASVSIRGGSE